MATFYIPNADGWSDNGTMGDTARLRLKVDRSYNAAANRSTLTITPQSYCTRWGGEFRLVADSWLKVNNSTVYSAGGSSGDTVNITVTYNNDSTWANVIDNGNPVAWETTVNHANDGSVTFNFSVYMRFYRAVGTVYSTFHNLSGSTTVTEARASTVTASDGTFDSNVAVTVTRASSSVTHTVTVTCAGRTDTLATKSSGVSFTWSPAVATYAPLVKNSMTATATVKCESFSGNTSIGVATKAITMTLPAASVKPTVAISVSDSEGLVANYGAYVATKSKLRIALTNTLQYGATLASTLIMANGTSYTTSPVVTGLLGNGQNTINVKIVDSRGQTGTASKSITILNYAAPEVTTLTVGRCNQDGTANNGGAYCKVTYAISVTPLNNRNSRSLTLKYKKRSDSSYTSQSITISSYTASGSVIFSADINYTYDIQLVVTDDFYTGNSAINRSTTLSTGAAYINFGSGKTAGIGIGMVNQTNKAVELAQGWQLIAGDAILSTSFYKVKGTVITDTACPAFGFLSQDGTQANIYCFLPAILSPGWTVTCDKAIAEMRMTNGAFLGGSSTANVTSYVTTCGRVGLTLAMTIVKSGGWGGTGATPIAGRMILDLTVGATT